MVLSQMEAGNVPETRWALELGLPDVVAGVPEKNGGPGFCMVGGASRIVDPLIPQRWLTDSSLATPIGEFLLLDSN
jgi:hypothetical protein